MHPPFIGHERTLHVSVSPLEPPIGGIHRAQGKDLWVFACHIERARSVLATFGEATPSGTELAARLNALAAAEAVGATHVPADRVEGTGLVVDAGPYVVGIYDRMNAIGFRVTWAPYEEGAAATLWFQHMPGATDPFVRPKHTRDCPCHDCVEVCCCGDYARDHTGYENHAFHGMESHARDLDAEAARKGGGSIIG